jgi:hypothetical protein
MLDPGHATRAAKDQAALAALGMRPRYGVKKPMDFG